MAKFVFAHPTNEFRSVQADQLGARVFGDKGEEWVYVEFDTGAGPVAFVSGAALTWVDRDAYKVTCDESSGTDVPAGVLVASARAATQKVPTDGQFGYIQTRGWHPAVAKVAGTDSFDEDDAVIVHSSSDGVATKASNTDEPTAADRARMIGRATGASEDTAAGTYNEDTVPVWLNIIEG